VKGPFLLAVLGVIGGCGGPREARTPEPVVAIDAGVDADGVLATFEERGVYWVHQHVLNASAS